ncbi:MAG: ABC transporter ATP-binding protein [Ruminococcaceae bacterium]|nr:ABC transporter ATP-binding protein [Oscillospiraceae bacterium]
MLKLSKIKKKFGEKQVLSEVSLSVQKGDCAMIFGMSGCGKTTLLRIAAGLEKQDGGMVEKEGKTAFVFAEARLFPTATALENITMVMREDKKTAKKKAIEILRAFGLENAAALYPSELSTGMAARVSLARAVAYDADVYLMDEPFKSLDGEIKQSVAGFLREFFTDKTVLMISHDQSEAKLMNASVYWMTDGNVQRKSDGFFESFPVK